jgi:hypothetical protein
MNKWSAYEYWNSLNGNPRTLKLVEKSGIEQIGSAGKFHDFESDRRRLNFLGPAVFSPRVLPLDRLRRERPLFRVAYYPEDSPYHVS